MYLILSAALLFLHHLCHEIAHLFGCAFLHLACDVGVGSYDRAFYILAITVCQADWDRRYSPDNRAWANAMSIPANPDAWGTDRNCYLAVNSHPGLVNLFLSQTRKAYAQERQKTSVRDMLKKLPETTSPKISAKSKAPER